MNATTIAGRFRLDEALSDRPTGKVWRGWDLREDRPVAVKTLYSAPSVEERVRFLREGAALKKLDHPNIACHVESGVDEHHGRFIVTEWVEGEDLETYLRPGPTDLLTGLDIALKLAAGLSHVHARGLLHRDLKPANIRFESQSRCIKLIDFGLARSFGVGAETTVTEPGQFLGTPRYVSPEQARGEPHIDPRSDVFSLGGILYRCFTGRPAFDASNLRGLLQAILSEPHIPLAQAVPDLPPRLTDLVDSMLAKEPVARPAHGQAVLEALEELGASFRLRSAEPSEIDWGRPHIHRWQVRGQIDGRAAPSMSEPALSKIAHPFGVRVVASGARTWSIEHDPGCEVVEAAQRVARCTLAVAEAWPQARGIIATSEPMATPVSAAVRGGAIDGIELDEDIARILFATFDIEPRGQRRVLLGARLGVRLHSRGGGGGFAGRDRELATLVATFQACVAEGRARTFVVEGGAGLGKTRLRFELLRHPSVRELDPFVLLCTGEPGGRLAALRALARGLRAALGLSPRFSRARLRAALRSLVGDDATLQSGAVIESVYQALSVGGAHATTLVDTTLSWDDYRRGILELARRVLAQQPLLVVIDDAPNVDAPSLGLVDHLMRTFSSAPLFVVSLARPHGDIPALASLTDGASGRIDLAPLDVEAARALIQPGLGEDAPPAEVERLVLLSGGNPRVAEELVEAAQLGGGENPGPVLEQWFESCLLSLRKHERAILRAAAVFGERFPKSGVRRILADRISRAELDGGLERLAALALVRPATEDDDDGWWRFAHPVLVKVIHAGLDPFELRAGHRVAGEHLALDARDEPAIVAEHFLTGQEPRAAAIWCHRAARHALRAEDLNGALDLAARGLAIAHGDDATGELLLIQAEAKLWLGDPSGATTDARTAMQSLARGTPPWAQAAGILSSAALRSGEHSVHRGLAAEAEDLLKDHFVSTSTLLSVIRLASDACQNGETQAIDGLFRRIQAVAHGCFDAKTVQAPLLTLRGALERSRGEFDAAVSDLASAASRYAEDGRHRAAAAARIQLADLLLHAGHDHGAREVLEDVIREARIFGWRSVLPEALAQYAWARLASGDSAALHELMLATQAAEEQHDRSIEVRARVYLARALSSLGRLHEAEIEAKRAVERASRTPPTLAAAMAELAACHVELGRLSTGLRFVQAALAIIQSNHLHELEERARLTEARALFDLGRVDEAAAAARRGVALVQHFADQIKEDRVRAAYLATPFRTRLRMLAKELDVA